MGCMNFYNGLTEKKGRERGKDRSLIGRVK